MAYEIESLLRPPVEFYATGAYFAIAIVAILAPEAFLLLPSVGYLAAAMAFARGSQRAWQGWRVIRYQRQLWRIPHYQARSSSLPLRHESLFIGRGFQWGQQHSQRLADTEMQHGKPYTLPPLHYHAARKFEDVLEPYAPLRPLATLLRSNSSWNPVRPLPDVGGNAALHAVGSPEGDQPIFQGLGERAGHMLVLGTTRVGKSRLAELLISQDIARGDVVIVLDPKGDAGLWKRVYSEAKRAGRLDDLHFFHLGYPELSSAYNPIGMFERVTEVAGRIAGQLPGEGQSAAFREFVWRYVNVIAKALQALGETVFYETIQRYGEDIEPLVLKYLEHYLEQHGTQDWAGAVASYEARFQPDAEDRLSKPRTMANRSPRGLALRHYFRKNDIGDDIARSLLKTYEYDDAFFSKLVASLLPLMEKLTTGKVADLLSPDLSGKRPSFTWESIIESGGIVYVGLDALTDAEVAAVVGASMLADLTSLSGRIYKDMGRDGKSKAKRRVYLHADELNELIQKQFIPMLNKAGGAGISVVAYTQAISDILAKLGDQALTGQVLGNFNSLVMLRVQELETAEFLTSRLKDVEVKQLTTVSRATDSSQPESSSDFTSMTEQRSTSQRVEMLTAHDLISLPKGQAFGLLNGGQLVKLRLPLPDDRDFDGIPAEVSRIADEMSSRYHSGDSWALFDPSWSAAA